MGACPERGGRRFGTRILCDSHYDWAQKVRARITNVGWGEHTTPAPDWPHGWANLTCWLCSATWTGPVGEACGWCQDRLDNQRRGQATLVLMEPDVELEAMEVELARARDAWQTRLRIAIDAELISKVEAVEAVNAWLEKIPAAAETAA